MKEVFTSPFTTATTCYSVPCDRSLCSLRFANETHVLGVSLPTATSSTTSTVDHSNLPTFSTHAHGLIPRDSPSLICIGYSQVPYDDSPSPIQAYALVDPLLLDKQQDTPQPLHRPDRTNTGVSDPAAPAPPPPDDASMVSSLPSHDMSSVISNTVPRTTLRNSTSAGDVSDKEMTGGRTSPPTNISTNHATSDADAAAGPTPQPPKARLVLQIPPLPSDPQRRHGEFVALLDFRPLSPCIIHVEQSVYLVVGSAEDSQLYCYQPNYTTNTINPLPFPQPTGTLERITLPDPSLVTMYTPIMGLEFHRSPVPWEYCYTLALTTQEGSIRIIQWQGKRPNSREDQEATQESMIPLFHQATVHDVLADGPLLRLHFQDLAEGGLRLLLGSLYGYVFSMTQPTAASSWEDPDMIVSGLWKDALQSEDPVLAVYTWKESIWVGTLGGRCLVYQRGILGHKYYLLWECTLPYSIHGFGVLLEDKSSFPDEKSSTTYMAVITRRTLHVLQLSLPMESSKQPPRYSLEAARKRMEELLKFATAEPTPPTPLKVEEDEEVTEDLATVVEGDERDEEEASTLSVLPSTEEVASSSPATATKPADSGDDTDDELVDYESWILFPKWPSQRSSQRSKESK